MSPRGPYEKYKIKEREREHRAQERLPTNWWWFKQRDPIVRFTLYVGLFTLALAVVGALQYGTMRSSDKTAIAEHRPWVSLKINPLTNLIFDKLGAHFAFDYVLKNTGHSPAMNVEFIPWFGTSGISVVDEVQLQKDRCEAARKTFIDNPQRGIAIFPGDEQTFRDEQGAISPDISDAEKKFGNEIGFVLYGCVLYSSDDGTIHQTPFIYRLMRIYDRKGMSSGSSYSFGPDNNNGHLTVEVEPSGSGRPD